MPAAAETPDCEAPKGLLTIREAAEFLHVSARRLHEATRRPPETRGSIPFVTLPTAGRRRIVRFDPVELRSWLAAGAPAVRDWRVMQSRKAVLPARHYLQSPTRGAAMVIDVTLK